MGDSSSVARDAAAAAAVQLVEPGMTIGLGSGRAVWKLVELLGERVAEGGDLAGRADLAEGGDLASRGDLAARGDLAGRGDRAARGLRAATASVRTDELAAGIGIELVQLDGTVELDLALDGADEVDPELRLIKGGGGALLREKIVISAARRFVVVAETPKRVERLGERFRLPVEVVRFAWRDTQRRLAEVLPDAERRRGDDGEPYVTDEGHFLLDCALSPETDLDALGREVKQIPGVVEHGLFIGLAERALLGRPDGGVDVLERR